MESKDITMFFIVGILFLGMIFTILGYFGII